MLELVELGPARAGRAPARSVARPSAASPSGRSMSRTKAVWSSTMNVGTPHTWWRSTASVCSALTSGEGLAGGDLVEHGVGVDAVAGQHLAEEGLVAQRLALVVAEGEQRRCGRRGTARGTSRARPRRPGGPAARCRARARPRRRPRPLRRGPGSARTARTARPSRRRRPGRRARARGRCGRTGSGSPR